MKRPPNRLNRPHANTGTYDAVMLMGFGAPERSQDVRPFLEAVLDRVGLPQARKEARIREVEAHYQAIGGSSPLNALTRRQALALNDRLGHYGIQIPVRVGMRNWSPYIRETLQELRAQGARNLLAIPMASLETEASQQLYRDTVDSARSDPGVEDIHVAYAAGFHASIGFVKANAENAASTLADIPRHEAAGALLVFTAHSIPVAMAQASPYVQQLEHISALVMESLSSLPGQLRYRIAYQSRSGPPSQLWLEPDINDLIRQEASRGTSCFVVCPVGFVCDHVEVLYDLDVEAAATAASCGAILRRARTAEDHPAFIDALAKLVATEMARAGRRGDQ